MIKMNSAARRARVLARSEILDGLEQGNERELKAVGYFLPPRFRRTEAAQECASADHKYNLGINHKYLYNLGKPLILPR